MRVEWLCLDTNLESVLELENKMTLFFFSLFKKIFFFKLKFTFKVILY